jgi:hypothetical protein
MSEVDKAKRSQRRRIITEEDKTGQRGPFPLLDHKHLENSFCKPASVFKPLVKERRKEVTSNTRKKVQHAYAKPDDGPGRVLLRHLTFSLTILGAYDERDPLGRGSQSFISWRMCFRPALACSNAFAITSTVMPSTLMSICMKRSDLVT